MKLEDALNLLLNSIALEEVSLSKMLDAETKKMQYILEEYKHEKISIYDTQDINKSVNQTIMNMIKLQMLLQFKLDNIMEVLPTTTTFSTTTTSTTSSTTTTTSTTPVAHTNTSTSSVNSTRARKSKKDKLVWRIP